MSEFELTLNNITYKCTSHSFSGNNQNWDISSKHHDLTVRMSIPIESKLPRSKVMLFIEIFHEALMEAKKKQKEELSFPQQLT